MKAGQYFFFKAFLCIRINFAIFMNSSLIIKA